MNLKNLTYKKALLDQQRPFNQALMANLQQWFNIELTYTSNAIEGNTLTRQETALVVEKGITVGGKSLIEHLEATNHAQALNWVLRQIARKNDQLTETDILQIHCLILKGIDDDNAGHYRSVPVRISGSRVILPNPRKVPEMMAEFADWLENSGKLHPVETAAEAHYRLVTIHPFTDGNGRTARLLMNLILLMNGYPPALIRPRDRLAYIKSLETAQTGGPLQPYFTLIGKAVDRSLNLYLKAINGQFTDQPVSAKELLKIGALAQKTGEANSTIRHWTQLGLLDVAEITDAGYHLYDPLMIERVRNIQSLQAQRFTLAEIKEKL